MKDYRFVDRWTIRAPLDEVYRHVANPHTYAEWWLSYDSVRILEDAPFPHVGGRVELVVKSPFGYRLHLEVETTEADPPTYLKTASRGQLAGTGIWEFSRENDATVAVWTWIVRSHHPLLNRLEWIAKPIFALSHVLTSRKGHQGLKRLLDGAPEAEFLFIP
jgi:uncharacterized protein YndB with AHSA1/START domain